MRYVYWQNTQCSRIADYFFGTYHVKTLCNACKRKYDSFEVFQNINLDPRELEGNYFTLGQLLKSFFCEIANPSIMDFKQCQDIQCMTQIRPLRYLYNLPRILIIQLKRFSVDMEHKFHYEVEYPVQRLNMNKYLPESKRDEDKNIYSLRAVICHSGSVDRGNYYTMGVRKDVWSLFDKQSRITISESEVVNPEAYVLIYDSSEVRSRKS